MHYDEPQATADGYEKPASSLLNIRCLGRPPIAVRGTITRSPYLFSNLTPVQTVEERDA